MQTVEGRRETAPLSLLLPGFLSVLLCAERALLPGCVLDVQVCVRLERQVAFDPACLLCQVGSVLAPI